MLHLAPARGSPRLTWEQTDGQKGFCRHVTRGYSSRKVKGKQTQALHAVPAMCRRLCKRIQVGADDVTVIKSIETLSLIYLNSRLQAGHRRRQQCAIGRGKHVQVEAGDAAAIQLLERLQRTVHHARTQLSAYCGLV